MMWYGRIHFEQKQEELDRSALLITKALADDADALRLWKRIYAVTSFFAGTSDDAGVCEYAPVMEAVYGLITKALADDADALRLWKRIYAVTSFFAGTSDDAGVCEYAPVMEAVYGREFAVGELAGKEREFADFHERTAALRAPAVNSRPIWDGDPVMEAVYGREFAVGELAGKEREFADFHERTAALRAPAVNSRPIWDGEENQIPGFRFMGQRFSVDAAVMQKLIYSDVGENGAGQKRMLPDVLDVPAALGSGGHAEAHIQRRGRKRGRAEADASRCAGRSGGVGQRYGA